MKKIIKNIFDNLIHESCDEAIITSNQIGVKLRQLDGMYFNYVLIQNNQIKYIGYSGSLYYRLRQHKQYGIDSAVLLQFESEIQARQNEKHLIQKFKPKLNSQYC
jgi:predicted GIY-YIG superfamily endonuclease